MTQARSQLVNPNCAGTYHCINRCVRRSWLCGFDTYSKQSFDHRKPWVEKRIMELGKIFACAIYAYAVMSNHLHLVVHMSPNTVRDWSAIEVATR
jgi:REP element-mobilizing transposase RayT